MNDEAPALGPALSSMDREHEGMQVTIPEDFAVFAREQAAAGVFSSAEVAVVSALRAHLDDVRDLRALLDPALASLDRGDGIDGPSFMRELIEETEVLEAGQLRT